MTASQDTTLVPRSDRRLADFAPWADSLSKGVAGLAIALYACGFLIVSIYHSQYGFIGINPRRPRILAAGAWFFFFTAIPVSVALKEGMSALRNGELLLASEFSGLPRDVSCSSFAFALASSRTGPSRSASLPVTTKS